MVFEVDDGTVRAHRALLTCRSEVMASMFTNDFLEKSAKLVTVIFLYRFMVISGFQCFDAVGCAAGNASGL